MLNLIRSTMYQIRRDKFLLIAFGFLLLFVAFMFTDVNFEDITGGDFFVEMSEMFSLMMMVPCVAVARICGWDFQDKTINYEILSGHSRRSVFLTKTLVSVLLSTAIFYAVTLIPVIVVTAIKGWGQSVSVSGAVIRAVLLLFPFLRMCCTVVFFTFLVRNGYVSMIFMYIMVCASMLVSLMVDALSEVYLGALLSLSNVMYLTQFNNSRLDFIDGKDVMVVDMTLSGSLAVQTVLVSLGVSALFLFLGSLVFRKSDMR